jgi:hypothetical protein
MMVRGQVAGAPTMRWMPQRLKAYISVRTMVYQVPVLACLILW